MATGQPMQQQPMLVDPSLMHGQLQQPTQSELAPPQVDPSQSQFDYYQQFQPAPQPGQLPAAQPQPIAGTPYYTQEQLAEGYKNMQRLDAHRQSDLAEMQKRYDQVVTQSLSLAQQRQQQPPAAQPVQPWELTQEQFTEQFNANPPAMMARMQQSIGTLAEQKAKELVAPLQQQLNGLTMTNNRQMVEQTYSKLGSGYGHLPNYDTMLTEAVNRITTDPVWIESAKMNPSAALETAFQAELGKNLSNPAFIQDLGKSTAIQHQQRQQQMQYAQPMTTASNVQAMPHQPLVNNGMPPANPNMLAHQIATYTSQEHFNPNGPRFQVKMNDMDF